MFAYLYLIFNICWAHIKHCYWLYYACSVYIAIQYNIGVNLNPFVIFFLTSNKANALSRRKKYRLLLFLSPNERWRRRSRRLPLDFKPFIHRWWAGRAILKRKLIRGNTAAIAKTTKSNIAKTMNDTMHKTEKKQYRDRQHWTKNVQKCCVYWCCCCFCCCSWRWGHFAHIKQLNCKQVKWKTFFFESWLSCLRAYGVIK